MREILQRSFYARNVDDVARSLIGCGLYVDGVGGTIVETEAYDVDDPASHSFRGKSARNAPMFGPAGHAYVYRSYGIHWCMNITCGHGAAVLIRALEPEVGLDLMRTRRGRESPRQLCSGPGKLCQALAIDDRFNGLVLEPSEIEVCPRNHSKAPVIANTPRIGLSVATGTLRRYIDLSSNFLSRPYASARTFHSP